VASITVEEAKALADDWKAQRDDYDRQPKASYFADCSAHDLIKMWETNKRKDGRKLSSYELGCLVEAWCQVFGCLPPFEGAATNPEQLPLATKTLPLPADDTMLRANEVERLTGISKSTIKRMVSDGRFPKPLRLGIRAKGWPTRDVRQFIETLDQQRRRPRQ
jgi:prophage regulatory protein